MTSDEKDRRAGVLAAAQGLQRAAELFPATVAAAIERGSKPLMVKEGGVPPVTPPATAFRPAIKAADRSP